MKSFFSQRRFWLQSINLKKQIVKDQIDLFWGGGEYIPVLLPKKIRTIATIHDVVFRLFPDTVALKDKLLYNFLLPISLKKTNKVLTISKNSKSEIARLLKYPDKQIDVIPNGIDLKSFKPLANIKKEDYVLFVGTLQPRKNLISLIKGFNEITKKIPHKLVIVGASGWKNSDLAKEINSLPENIVNQIVFKGYIDNNQLIDLYQKADIFIAPSLHEGFGLIIAEAIACGTPVITSKRGAIEETFEDIPEYIDPLSPTEIGETILNLIKDNTKKNYMIKKGLNFIKKYDIEKATEKYIEYFNSFNDGNR